MKYDKWAASFQTSSGAEVTVVKLDFDLLNQITSDLSALYKGDALAASEDPTIKVAWLEHPSNSGARIFNVNYAKEDSGEGIEPCLAFLKIWKNGKEEDGFYQVLSEDIDPADVLNNPSLHISDVHEAVARLKELRGL